MTDSEQLIKISQQLGKVQGSMEGVHGEMKGVRKEVKDLRGEISGMPDQWRTDAKDIVENKLKQRDEVASAKEKGENTGVANLARERARAAVAKSSNGFLTNMFKGTGKFVMLVVVLFGMGAGTMIFTQCNDTDKIDKAALEAHSDKLMERFAKQLDVKFNGGIEEAGEGE